MTSEEYLDIDKIMNDKYSRGYQQGYKKGIAEGNVYNGMVKESYKHGFDDGNNKGMNEAWAVAKRIIRLWFDVAYQDPNRFSNILGLDAKLGESVFEKFFEKSAAEGVEFVQKWERKRMLDRDCENCKHQTVRDSNGVAGCVKWQCEFEPREEELQVGDEVIFNGDKDDRAYITHMIKADGKIWCSMIHSDGSVYEDFDHMLTKTGKHVDIGEMLKQIQEG